MKATVCQFGEGKAALEESWAGLVEHVRDQGSDLVLLPEMPFHDWLPAGEEVDVAAWEAAVQVHDHWMSRLRELSPAMVAGSRPVTRAGRRLNEAFLLDRTGYHGVHDKVYLPDEEMFWEASWYEPGDGSFGVCEAGKARLGFLICTELWFTEHARSYGRRGAHIIACPRATPGTTADKWIAGGRAAAVCSGTWCLSSNRGGLDERGRLWAGAGWIIEPEAGEVLASTSVEEPFVTREISLEAAQAAKNTYPRYVRELD